VRESNLVEVARPQEVTKILRLQPPAAQCVVSCRSEEAGRTRRSKAFVKHRRCEGYNPQLALKTRTRAQMTDECVQKSCPISQSFVIAKDQGLETSGWARSPVRCYENTSGEVDNTGKAMNGTRKYRCEEKSEAVGRQDSTQASTSRSKMRSVKRV